MKLVLILICFCYFTLETCQQENLTQKKHLSNLRQKNSQINQAFINLTESQAALYKRIKINKNIINPYIHLNASQICSGTSNGLGSGTHNYAIWRSIYKNCVYLEGNLEINNFDPYNVNLDSKEIVEYNSLDQKLDTTFDFSFLDDIKEITGYLIVSNNRIKNLRLKNLEIIRGRNLFGDLSVYISSNIRLETLELLNLKEIQRGRVIIEKNPKLCHMDEVNWKDIISNDNPLKFSDHVIRNNGDPSKCPKCKSTCCSEGDDSAHCGSCWFPNGCQKLNRVVCHSRCEGRCYGPGPFDCCDSECIGGCNGPTKKDCIACKSLRIYKTGECVSTCPKVEMSHPITKELIHNPDGLYQFGIICVKQCPANFFVHNELCLAKCPNLTYQEEELIVNADTGEKGVQRVCKQCTLEKCPKICYIEKIGKKEELTLENLKNLQNCEILNSNLLILQPTTENTQKNMHPQELTETDLEILESIKVINGFVRIQSNTFKSLSFLRNLEVIRSNNLVHDLYSVIINSKSLKTLGLNKLKSIENGDVVIKAESLCLQNTIDWTSILNKKNSININKNTLGNNCENEGYVCDSACKGCWSQGPKSCQFCKTYKLDDRCVENCSGLQKVNKNLSKYIFLYKNETRECQYCHAECKHGCSGPTEFDCFECSNYKLKINETTTKCVEKCPLLTYSNPNTKECFPCYKDCYECTGPKDTIGPNGCTRCSNAIVDNDPAYTIIRCIAKDNDTCGENHFLGVVPENLKEHPLKGKKVCRKCNDECDNCFENGVKLHTQCKKCRNYYSFGSDECVNNCSSLKNEYLEENKKICKSCSVECKSGTGCIGSGVHQCNECRAYKLTFIDTKRFIDKLYELKSKQFELDIEMNSSLKNQFEFYKDLIQNYDEYIRKNDLEFFNDESPSVDQNNAIFCVSECPPMLPYKTSNLYCTDNKKLQSLPFLTALIGILIVIIVLALIIISILRFKEKSNRIRDECEKKFFNPHYDENKDDYEDSTKFKTSNLRLLQADSLEFGTELGKGAFGTVFEGYYKQSGKKIRVAIKVLNKCKAIDDKLLSDQLSELLNEATLMASVDHKYCLQLTALCMAEPVMMITQLMPFGSAVSFLQKYKHVLVKDNRTENMLLVWSQQIAEGMNYLESLGIVHRDLAARNILIKSRDHIKITDFGLSRIVEPSEDGFVAKGNSLVPVKWLAIESIRFRLFTHKSDVWSYAVCLWELYTFCAKPYAEIDSPDIANSIIKGVRLAQPQMASIEIYKILLNCWVETPGARPTFSKLSDDFSKMSLEPKRYLSMKEVNFDKEFITINEKSDELLNKLDDLMENTSLNENEENKKFRNKKSPANSSNILSDEGIDLNSFEIGSSIGDASNTINSNFNQISNLSELNDGNNDSGQVIIFKRSNTFSKVPQVLEETDNSSILEYLTQTNVNNKLNSQCKPNQYEKTQYTSINSTKNSNNNNYSFPNNNNNKSNFKAFKGILKINRSNRQAQRLNSQISTGTTSTYLSSIMSTSSDGLPSPKLPNEAYEEEGINLLSTNSTRNSMSLSLTPSRSNSNSSSNSYDFNKQEMTLMNNRNSNNTNINSDYLEPVTHNIRQNFEYFNDPTNINIKQIPSINVISDNQSKPKPIYYNDDVSNFLTPNYKQTSNDIT